KKGIFRCPLARDIAVGRFLLPSSRLSLGRTVFQNAVRVLPLSAVPEHRWIPSRRPSFRSQHLSSIASPKSYPLQLLRGIATLAPCFEYSLEETQIPLSP